MDKNNEQNNLNMKNSGGYQGSPRGSGNNSGGPDGTPNAPRFDRIIIYIVIGLLLTIRISIVCWVPAVRWRSATPSFWIKWKPET